MKTRTRISVFLHLSALVLLGILLFCNTQSAMRGIRYGLSLCQETIFPALFPFLILSDLIANSEMGSCLGRTLGRPLGRLLRLSPCAASSLVLGYCCGQPVAATTAIASCKQGELDKKELRRLTLFANTPSSGFLIAAVGTALFGNKQAGIALFCITILSAFLVGLGTSFFSTRSQAYIKKAPNGMRKTSFLAELTGSVKRAFSTLLQICAFLLFFCALGYALCELLQKANAPTLFCTLVMGALEMTCGIAHAAATLSAEAAFRCAAFFAGFAGFSVALQIFSLADGYELHFPAYFLSKLAQGTLNLLFCEIYLRLFAPVLTLRSTLPTFSKMGSILSHHVTLALLFLIIVGISHLPKFSRRKKRYSTA